MKWEGVAILVLLALMLASPRHRRTPEWIARNYCACNLYCGEARGGLLCARDAHEAGVTSAPLPPLFPLPGSPKIFYRTSAAAKLSSVGWEQPPDCPEPLKPCDCGEHRCDPIKNSDRHCVAYRCPAAWCDL